MLTSEWCGLRLWAAIFFPQFGSRTIYSIPINYGAVLRLKLVSIKGGGGSSQSRLGKQVEGEEEDY